MPRGVPIADATNDGEGAVGRHHPIVVFNIIQELGNVTASE